MITKDDLDKILEYYNAATQGDINTIQITKDIDPVEWFRECLAKCDGEYLYGVACGTAEKIEEGEHYWVTAFTGNGPTSLANANFYAMCHMAIPLLVEEIRTLQNKLEEIEDFNDLPGGDT